MIIQLYVILDVLTTMSIKPEVRVDLNVSPYPITISSLVSTSISLLLTLISYVASDRLSSENRRVVIPGYLILFLWHICLVSARIASIAIFTVAYGPYVAVIIGIHWISSVIWTFAEKTNICGDSSTTPHKKRHYLEIPFVIIISFIFTFLYFNVHDGSTLGRIIVYHILTSIETALISALFYAAYPSLDYAPWVFAAVVGVYILGVAFMFLYYAAWHPSRTEDCLIIGCPKSDSCCKCFSKSGPYLGNVDLPLSDIGHNSNMEAHLNQRNSTQDTSPVGDLTTGNIPPIEVTNQCSGEALAGAQQTSNSQDLSSSNVVIPFRYSSASQYHFDMISLQDQQFANSENYFIRSNSERFSHKPRIVSIQRNEHCSQTELLSRNNPWRHSEGHIYSHQTPKPYTPQYVIVNSSMPSPIGEETTLGETKKLAAPPVVQIFSATDDPQHHTNQRVKVTSSHIQYDTPSQFKSHGNKTYLEPLHYQRCKARSELARKRSNQTSPNYCTHNMYSTPRPNRHRSLSPGISDYSHSTSTTPKQSPYSGRKRSRVSNPLHTHDPMMEFTRLYSSNPAINYTKIQKSEDGIKLNRRSTSSSYILNPDDHPDITDIHILKTPTKNKDIFTTTPVTYNVTYDGDSHSDVLLNNTLV